MSSASSSFQRARLDLLFDRLPLQIGHREEGLPVNFIYLIDRADIRMIQRRCGLRFTEETGFMFLVFEDVGTQEFQSYGAFELGVFGLVDNTHPAPAEFGEDLVVADRRAGHDAQLYRSRIPAGKQAFPPAIRFKAMVTQ